MRKALLPVFLLVLGAVVLGATLFPEQIVHAAETPFQNVVVQNTSTNPVPVTQVGTSTTSVTGTVGIDSGQNTVKLDPNGNTVNLGSTDSGHLANIDSATSQLHFDGSGNLLTAAQTAAPGAVREQCTDSDGESFWSLTASSGFFTLCSGQDFYLTDLTAAEWTTTWRSNFSTGATSCSTCGGAGATSPDRPTTR